MQRAIETHRRTSEKPATPGVDASQADRPDRRARGVDQAGPGSGAGPVAPPPAYGPVGPGPAPAPAAPTGVSAGVPTNIRAPSTPAKMAADRIPPRVDTDVSVSISGWSIPMAPVTLSVDGTGGGNGSVTIDGAATASLTASATVKLRGATQTAPGNAGNLSLVATQGGTELARSAGFSVAAIPRNVSISHRSTIKTATMRGMVVNTSLESDSGTVADLDRAEFSEQVQYGKGKGVFTGYTGKNSGYLPANGTGYVDTHSTPVSWITGDGEVTAEQTFIFKDDRTGVTNVPMANSGYRIRRVATAVPLIRVVVFDLSKSGASTKANGYSSAAGSGNASVTQTVP